LKSDDAEILVSSVEQVGFEMSLKGMNSTTVSNISDVSDV